MTGSDIIFHHGIFLIMPNLCRRGHFQNRDPWKRPTSEHGDLLERGSSRWQESGRRWQESRSREKSEKWHEEKWLVPFQVGTNENVTRTTLMDLGGLQINGASHLTCSSCSRKSFIGLFLLQTTINPLTLLFLLLKLGKLGQLALCLSARGVIIHERKREQSWIINVLISFNWQRGLVCFLVQFRRFNFVRWITIN